MKGKKTGGRQKGTPNKATAFSKTVIQELLDDYTSSDGDKKFKHDIEKLEAKDRLDIMVKLMSFITPKPQSVDMSITSTMSKTIEDTLTQLSEENEE